MPPRPLSSFLARLIWLSVLPPMLAATWLAFDSILTQRAATRQQATNLAKNFITSLDRFLQARINGLSMLAQSPLADTPQTWPALYAEAHGYRESFGSHVILAGIDEPMPMLLNTRVPLGTKLPSLPRAEGQAAGPTARATGKPAVSDTIFGPVAKVPLIAIAVPGIRANKVAHVLLTTMETVALQERLDTEAIPDAWALTLQDGNGAILARRAPAGFDSLLDVDADGRFTAASQVSRWSLTLEIPRQTLHEQSISTGLTLALAIAMATIAGVLGGTSAGRRLGRQVTSLSDTAETNHPLTITEIAAARHLLDAAAASQRLNESRYQATFEHASIGIAQLALDGLCVQVNRAICAMFGYTQDEFRSITWQQLTPPDELPVALEYVRKLVAGDMASYNREKRFLGRNNKLFWANLGVTLIRKPDGSPDYFIAIVEHIQARKDAEAALHERDALLTDMGTMTHVGGWSFAPLTGAGHWTAEAARIHDLPEDQPVDVATGLSFYSAEHRPVIEAAIQAAIKEAEPYDLELEMVTALGQRKWVRTIGHPVLENGKVIQVRGAIQDITEQKSASMALVASEQRYRQLVENANSAILQWAPDGTIFFFNEHAQQLFGWSAEEIVGQHVGILVPERETSGTDLSGLVQEISAHPERFRHNINENIRRDGSRLWMSWTNRALVDQQGQTTAILAIGSDITEHKLILEELRRRNEELERFDQASVGRELQMIELKRQINELSRQLGQEPPFDLTFVEVAQ